MTKALVLLSGGLDSMLAAKILLEQGVEVTGLSFKSYFFSTAKAKKAAKQLGIKLIEIDFSDEHLDMVKNPKYGYGKNMNPCIDCHAMMLKKAAEYLTPACAGRPTLSLERRGGKFPLPSFIKGGFDLVATGEVLGERPMSQNAEALKIVEKDSGLKGRLIRPLSAKLLDESDLEKAGKINRGKLLDISGRSRQRQLELVKKYGIKEYASPGGGCLLTDPVFSEKLLKILEYWPDCVGSDIELLKYGRVFWLKTTSPRPCPSPMLRSGQEQGEGVKNILIIIGRDQKDNAQLEKLAGTGDVIMQLVDENGPTSLIRSKKFPPKIVAPARGFMPEADKGSAPDWDQPKAEEVRSKNEMREVDVPEELKMSELKLGEKKSQEEIINLALMLTGYYATKSRGKKVKLEIQSKK